MMSKIRTYGDAVLRGKTVRVQNVDGAIGELVEAMLETMRAHNGIGLAAPQVGRKESLCVVDIPAEANDDPLNRECPMPLVLINPEIIGQSDESCISEEGCLSFPGIYAPIERPAEIKVSYLDRHGGPATLTAQGLLARCIQHEVDHLNGILLSDRMTPFKKIALAGRLKRLRRETRSGKSQ